MQNKAGKIASIEDCSTILVKDKESNNDDRNNSIEEII